MREVAADDKQVLLREIRLQHLSYLFEFPIVVGRDDNGHDGRYTIFAESPLKEWQLHLQTVLPVVCLGLIREHTIRGCQFLSRLSIHPHVSQRCRIEVSLRIHRCPVEPFMMTWPQQENTFEGLVRGNRHVGSSSDISREIIPGMRHYQCCHIIIYTTVPMQSQKAVHLLAQFLCIACVESIGLRRRSNHPFFHIVLNHFAKIRKKVNSH